MISESLEKTVIPDELLIFFSSKYNIPDFHLLIISALNMWLSTVDSMLSLDVARRNEILNTRAGPSPTNALNYNACFRFSFM